MKIAIPLGENADQNAPVYDHFGSSPLYGIANTEDGSFTFIANESTQHEHGQCTPAELFSSNGVDTVLCKGIGAGAIAKLASLGIAVVQSASAPTAREALAAFLHGSMAENTDLHTCPGHNCH